MAGLLSGAIAGAGKAMQFNAQSSIEEKRQRALKQLSFKHEEKLADTKWGREKQLSAAQAAMEERRRQEDREWELSDAEREHRRDLELQRVRNQRGYGSGPTAKQREAEWLVEQGIAPDLESAWPMVSARADQGGETIDYVESRIEELESVLNDPDALTSGIGSNAETEEDYEAEVRRREEQLRSDLEYYRGKRDELAAGRYKIRPPGLLSQGLNGGDGSGGGGGGQPDPSSRQGAGGTPSVDDILNSVLR